MPSLKQLQQQYGVAPGYDMPEWKFELLLWAARAKTKKTPYYHLRRAMEIMWPQGIWHPWKEWRLQTFCDDSKALTVDNKIVRNFSWMGCVSGDTRIFDPIANTSPAIKELSERGQNPNVLTIGGPAMASVPRMLGTAELYEVTLDSGFSFKATGWHRVLLEDGTFVSVDFLTTGARLLALSDSAQPWSIWEPGQPAQLAGAWNSLRTAAGSPADYPRYSHFCDERPLSVLTASPALATSPAGVRERTRLFERLDGLCEPARTRLYQHVCRHSSAGFEPADSRNTTGLSPCLVLPKTGEYADAWFQSDAQSQRWKHHPKTSAEPASGFFGRPRSLRRLSSQPIEDVIEQWVSLAANGRAAARVVQWKRRIGRQSYYDMTVPGWGHYYAEGAFHHNCGAAGKTNDAIELIIPWWLADPNNSIATLVSTTKERARARMWAVLQKKLFDFQDKHGKQPFHPVDSSMIIEAKQGERKHAIYVLAVEAGELTRAIANIVGSHAPRMFLIVDEAMGTPESIFEAVPNIFKGAKEVNLLWLSNAPLVRLNPFMKLACPEGGWTSKTPDDQEWRTREVPKWQIPNGYCLHFSGKHSPNVLSKKEVCPGLYSYADWQRVASNPEITKTPAFWSQDLGFPPPEGALFTVITESLIDQKTAMGRHEFLTYATPIAGLDPSFGNDECALTFGVMGDIQNGLTGIQVTDHLAIPIDVLAKDEKGKKIPPDYQIAARVQAECLARGVKPTHLGVLSTGNPGCVSRLQVEFGDIFTIQESGAASDDPASMLDFRPAHEVYDRRVTELYFLVRSFIEGEQLKGLYEEAINQLCNRLYDVEKSTNRQKIEKKEVMRGRYGRSPDNAESLIAMCAVARHLGVEPLGVEARATRDWRAGDTDEQPDTEDSLHTEDIAHNQPEFEQYEEIL